MTYAVAATLAVLTGVATSPLLVRIGLPHTGSSRHGANRNLVVLGSAATASCAAVLAGWHDGTPWWIAFFEVWAMTLACAAVCDALTQRVPRLLTRTGGALALATLIAITTATDDWQRLVVTATICVVITLSMSICWRFAGLGYGDVRLAAIGSLGLGRATMWSAAMGVVVFVAVCGSCLRLTRISSQAAATEVALGPALAAGFLAAAAVSA